MPEVELYITDRPGTGSKDTMRRMFQYSDLEIVHPLSDVRTCRFKSPIYDVNALGQSNIQHLKLPLRRFVKVFYLGRLIFWGPIMNPIFNLQEGTVETSAVGGAIPWLMNHHFHTGDDALAGVEYTSDGLWDLFSAARLTASEDASGFKELLMVAGALEAMDGLLDVDSNPVLLVPEIGANVWDTGTELTDSAAGPEFDILPIDEDHDPDGAFAAATVKPICQLNAGERLGQDRATGADAHIFHFGFGRTNLGNFIYAPDGSLLRNRFVAQHEDDKDLIKVAKHGDSMQAIGILEGWETPVGDYTPEGLGDYARKQVETYGEVPQTFTIEPVWDQGLMGSAASTPWRYPTGFYTGDTIRGVAKKGELYVDLIGRVTNVTLTQVNAAENVQSQVEMIPEVLDFGSTVNVDDEA